MEHADKLALARRVLELTMRQPFASAPPGKPQPPPQVIERMEEMMSRRRALTAEVYAEHLTDEQLLAMERHHSSKLMRATDAAMPAVHAEVSRRMSELWDSGKNRHNVAFSKDGALGGLVLATGEPPLNERQVIAVQRLMEEERYIETSHGTLIRKYLKAIEDGVSGAELAQFYTPDAEQLQHPNRLNPHGGRSDLATLLARAEKGKQLLGKQSYELLSLVASRQHVATEVLWTGTLAVQLGALHAGSEMRAHIAMFFEMKDGRIHRQRNYDCFEAR